MKGSKEMLTVETIRKIRLAKYRHGKSIREIAKDLHLSKNTVRRILRSDQTGVRYMRTVQPRPRLGPFVEILSSKLSEDEQHPSGLRRTAQVLFEELQQEGYTGAYDSVQRFVKKWKGEHRILSRPVFVPLSFERGEAFQFDWSHEQVELGGMPATVKVAHIRLCYSRLFLCIAYPRESQEMVFDAHTRAFEFFGGVCKRGIYDNMKTAVTTVLRGKDREFNHRFGQLCSHYLFDPVACTPGAGWEKGQVENQVGLSRKRFFTPRPRFGRLDELNTWLMNQCLSWAKAHAHPTLPNQTVWQTFEQERPFLLRINRPFDGYAPYLSKVSSTSLVSFDRNRYSVLCTEVGRTVELRVYAHRVLIVSNGKVVGEHERQFGRDKTVFNPWHYLPVLCRKPGALRNGAPFKDWDLPHALNEIREALQRYPDWDRQFVGILSAVPTFGLDAVEKACKEALANGTVSKDVVLNLLSRHTEQKTVSFFSPPAHLNLTEEPVADCGRYDRLLREAGDA